MGIERYSHNASLYPGVQMGTSEFNAGENPVIDQHPILVTSCYKNQR